MAGPNATTTAADTSGFARQRRGGGTSEFVPVRTAVVEELSDTSEEEEAAVNDDRNKVGGEKKNEEDAQEKDSRPRARRPSARERVADDDDYSPWVDVLRVLSFLVVASCALSYLVSGGESFTWGMQDPPRYLQLRWWQAQLRGPIYLTPEELAQYDGRDPQKPIYLAINGSIFDVSANRRTYGPGGSYRFFAGADASRAYVTGCFAEDRTADLRGAEAAFLPLDDPAADARYPAAELARLRRRERADARERVREALAHWVQFFERNPKYPKVGYVRRDPAWLDAEPRRPLCDAAQKARRPRPPPAAAAEGEGDVEGKGRS
ncbi:cytochrome b5 [Durotheca rogersii]|uniref:cytochrome b5 n=1 Tax=Durotheca rogersii TaxID=419775 RepID=UPI002220D92F|nr:cytochrome b5 [Durotheca rogersii]KAI5862401.1 cytochrome b5 [Durotheca rogersii]